MELKGLNEKIVEWAIERNLDKEAKVEAQSIKTCEEFSELVIGLSKDKRELIEDSIGDVYVTCVVGNLISKFVVDLVEVYEKAQKEYKNLKTIFFTYGIKSQISYITSCMRNVLTMGYTKHSVTTSLVCLIALSDLYGLPFEKCVESAYKEIKDRKGRMINGQFVKESDLND